MKLGQFCADYAIRVIFEGNENFSPCKSAVTIKMHKYQIYVKMLTVQVELLFGERIG